MNSYLNVDAQRIIEAFKETAYLSNGGFSIRHGIANVLLHITNTEQIEATEAWYVVPSHALESLADQLNAPALLERAMTGDSQAAKQFLHEAGFTDASGNWLPQYQSTQEIPND